MSSKQESGLTCLENQYLSPWILYELKYQLLQMQNTR